MKIISVLVAFLSVVMHNAYGQNEFKFNECLNRWSDFKDAGSGIKVKAAYIRNDINTSWMTQFLNSNDKDVTFEYTVYGGNSHFKKTIMVSGHGVSPIVSANEGLGDLWGMDIYIACSNFRGLPKILSQPLPAGEQLPPPFPMSKLPKPADTTHDGGVIITP